MDLQQKVEGGWDCKEGNTRPLMCCGNSLLSKPISVLLQVQDI